jgi:hypothetical protein
VTTYVQGRNDGIKRACHRVPPLHDHEVANGYSAVSLLLEPGKWVRQIVADERIKVRREGERP